jgi:CDP-diacylglycerol--serine O-phosphatidyltransferase
MLLDSLDGRVARLMQAETLFGAQYDSLSDLINFGLAPALLAYQISLNQLGRFGWVVAFVYTAATALRLARFNTQKSKQDYRYFVGIPCPAAAGCIAGLIWIATDWQWVGTGLLWKFSLVSMLLLTSYAMISPIRYYAFKDLTLRRKMPHTSVLLIVGLFGSIAYNPPIVLFMIFFGYLISGILIGSKKYFIKRHVPTL